MNFLRKFWPFSFKEKNEVKDLVIMVVIYVVAAFVVGLISGLLSRVPVLNILLSLVSYLCGLYCTAGIVFTFLNYFKVGPFKN